MPVRLRRCAALFPLALALVGLTVVTTQARATPAAHALASTVVPAVDSTDRDAVNALYVNYYAPATPAIAWTGAITGCDPGSVSVDYQLAVLRRINYYRALAGVRADTTLAAVDVASSQAAALMMSAANDLSHAPGATWPCTSAVGTTGAGSSNLALGATGPDAVDLYMEDPGSGNASVGHRWWLLQPNATTFASGNVPATASHMAANAVHVTDVDTFAAWPAVRDPAGAVLWPPRGYVPRPQVPDRWSAFDHTTDFSNAAVTVTVDGAPVTVVIDTRTAAGVLVWHVTPALPDRDLNVHVVITGAVGPGGAAPTIDYTSLTFTPSVAGVAPPPPVTALPDYHPVVPERLLDTRPGGPQVGYVGAKPAAGQTVELQVTGAGTSGIPADVVAVALNVTVTEPAGPSYVTAWPCGQPRPTASNVNVAAGQTLPNLVVVRPGTGGRVCLYTLASAHLVADVNGWFPAGTTFAPTQPQRLLDTRPGGPQLGYTGGKPAVGGTVELRVTGAAGVAADASAAVLNVTVTEPDAATFVTVWPCGEPRPTASNVNAVAGQTVANLVVARLGAGGRVCLFTQNPTHLVADLDGWFPSSTSYLPTSPARLLDTRPGTSVGGDPSRLVAGGTLQLAVAGAGAQPDGRAVVLNVTAVGPAAAGFVTVWPCGSPRPTASNLNVTPGLVSANLVIVAVDTTGAVCFDASTALDLVVDRNGDF